jgi:glycosyltransferase
MLKISVITVVKNGMPYLKDCLKSFELQDYINKEHIIVYSKSKDFTEEFLTKNKDKNKNCKIIYDKKSNNKFGALNVGIKHCSGDIIGILHADDIFFSNRILSIIAKNFPEKDIVYGNIFISNRKNILLINRNWKSTSFDIRKLYNGWMPPHTSIFIKKEIIPNYSIRYEISGDYEFILKIFLLKNLKIKFLRKNLIIMRSGGDSSRLKLFIKKFKEDKMIYSSYFKKHKPFFAISIKILSKIFQFRRFYLSSNKYLKNFENKKKIKCKTFL